MFRICEKHPPVISTHIRQKNFMTSKNPIVSVILPTYNREHLIVDSIQSILSQTFQNFEIIVVDDGSTDNTEKTVSKIRDHRIKYLKYPENRGATYARNIGIKQASGTYIAFQDSDDLWLPDKLTKQVKSLQKSTNHVGAVYTGYWWIVNGKKHYMPFLASNKKKVEKIISRLFFLFVGTPTVLLKRECFERVGLFDEKLIRLQEWELWIRISMHYHFEYIDEALVVSHYQSDGITANYQALVSSYEYILKKHYQLFNSDKARLAQLFAIFGRHLLNSPNTVEPGRRYLSKAVKLRPLNLKYLLYLSFSRLGFDFTDRLRKFYQSIKQTR